MINLIKAVIATLDKVEVKGKDNMDKLLGSINALETVAQMMEQQPAGKADSTTEEVANG